MTNVNVWIDKKLYDEVKKVQKSLQLDSDLKRGKGKKNKKITFLHTTKEIGKNLNTLRNIYK